MSQSTVLERMALVHLDITVWSGQAKLTAEDLNLGADGSIPPEQIAQLGNKRICSPDQLKVFNSLRSSAWRYLLTVGMRLMGGFAIPVDRMDEVQQRLNEIGDEFRAAKDQFMVGYDKAINDWCVSNPEWAPIIRRGIKPRESVARRLDYGWEAFQIANGDLQTSGTVGVEKRARQLGGDLMDEVIETATNAWDTHLAKGADKVTVHIRTNLKRLRDKLHGLAFLDHRFSTLVGLLDEALRFMPEGVKGPVKGEGFFRISSVVQILSDIRKIDGYVAGSVTVGDFQTVQSSNSVPFETSSTQAKPMELAGLDALDQQLAGLDALDQQLSQLSESNSPVPAGGYF